MKKRTTVAAVVFFLLASCVVFFVAEARAAVLETTGYIEGYFYPPHNEYDPSPGVEFSRRIVARYGLEAYTELRSKKTDLFLFINPFILFGDTLPQTRYNYDADPIVIRVKYGAGYMITNGLSIRVTHSEWKDLGKYAGERLIWSAVSLRYQW